VSLLYPIGFTLVAWSALPPDQAARASTLALLAVALALLGYLALGFGLHFGGVAFISENEGLQELARFFSLARGDDSVAWGILGLEGFFLNGDAATPAAIQLFVSQLPLVTTAALIVMLALPRHTPPLAKALAGFIVSTITYPLAGHWVSGGGWLAQLGHTLNLGHGLVDFAGSGTVFVVSGATALAAALVFGRQAPSEKEETVMMPPAYAPLLSGLGALLAAVGWLALGLVNPLYAEPGVNLDWSRTALNGLAGLAGGTLLAQLYSWFASGDFDPLMGPRGALAGLIAVSVGAPFLPIWTALAVGAVAGLCLPLATYLIKRLLHMDDAPAVTTTYGLTGLWGLLAVAFFADGRWGQGWNGTSGLAGQGVSGLLVASGLQADGGQLGAQVWGGIALVALGLLVPWGAFRLLSGLLRLRTRLGNRSARHPSPPSDEIQSTSGSLDGVINIDDGR